MRLVRRENNPNKETLIYIPYTSFHQQLSIYNPNCCMTRYVSILAGAIQYQEYQLYLKFMYMW